jgi:HEAT repeat protein
MLVVLPVAGWCAMLIGVAYGQSPQGQSDRSFNMKVSSVIDSLKQGTYGPATQEQIDEAQTGQLVLILETRFVTSQDAEVKARVARALVDLGDKGNAYWDFLVQQAKLAIESDVPSSRCFSSTNCTGHAEYVVWAQSHHAPQDAQAEMELHWRLEERVQLVFGDPRGTPLLREALKSLNINVVSTGADGLTRAHDKDSIPFIVEACKRFHDADEVRLIAHTLRQFQSDPGTRAAAQAAEEQCLPPLDPIEALKRNNGDSMFYAGKAATTHPKETLAILKQNFANTQDESQQAQIASALLSLGNKEDIYWNVLLRQATSALEDNASSVVKNNSQGKPIEGPSPEDAWAKQDMLFNRVITLAEIGDPRGVPFLQRALSSSNPDIQMIAAGGLARTRDNDSVPLLINMCKTVSPDMASALASQVLVYFDDPRARSAVDHYLSKEAAKFARQEKANGVGPLGSWPP